MPASSRDISEMVSIMSQAIEANSPDLTALEAWQLAGRVLCPIFDYAKPETYVTQMTAARDDFSGIASDADQQEAFLSAATELANAGSLNSLEQAVNDEAWATLNRWTLAPR